MVEEVRNFLEDFPKFEFILNYFLISKAETLVLAGKSFFPPSAESVVCHISVAEDPASNPPVSQGKVGQKSNPRGPAALRICGLCALFYCLSDSSVARERRKDGRDSLRQLLLPPACLPPDRGITGLFSSALCRVQCPPVAVRVAAGAGSSAGLWLQGSVLHPCAAARRPWRGRGCRARGRCQAEEGLTAAKLFPVSWLARGTSLQRHFSSCCVQKV